MDKETWIDFKGQKHKIPKCKSLRRLRPTKFYLYKLLRDYIFERDKYTCQNCEAKSSKKLKDFICFSFLWGQKNIFSNRPYPVYKKWRQ